MFRERTSPLRLIAAGALVGGAFTPGPANFVLHLYNAPANVTPTEYDTRTIAITLLPSTPTITSLVPASTDITLGSGFTSYTATVDNPGAPRAGIILQGWISQGTARRVAGGTVIICSPGAPGDLPTGTCTAVGDIVAGNGAAAGTGTLGPPTYELQL